jgi:DNA polymerase-1
LKRLLHIDGDILEFQVATMLEVPTDWGDDFWTLHADAKRGKEDLDHCISNLKDTLKADEMVLALSNYDNPFRKQVLPTYKNNRKATRKPIIWGEMRNHLKEKYVWKEKPGLEGDDILGIMATNGIETYKRKGIERIIVTIDKDLLTIPGLHYNMRKQELGIMEISEADADYFHMMQTLMGDQADGYSGCPGVGPSKAEKILGDCERTYKAMWPKVVAAYVQAKLSEAVALQMARVARILRASDYDFKKQEVKLWNP